MVTRRDVVAGAVAAGALIHNMNGAEFSQFLARRLAEASEFYNAVGLGAKP